MTKIHEMLFTKIFFRVLLKPRMCLIFMNMSKTGSLLDFTAVSAEKGPV